MTTQRAQELIDASMQFTLRPKSGDRERLIAFILRAAAVVIEEIADELEELK